VTCANAVATADDIEPLWATVVWRFRGELMEPVAVLACSGMERAIKERMSSSEIDTVMQQDLINRKPAACCGT